MNYIAAGRTYHGTSAPTVEVAKKFHTRVAILDAGAQYSKVIDRRLRELNVYCDILSLDCDIEELKTYNAIVISGGPQSVYGTNAPKYDPRLFDRTYIQCPIYGICYGMQLINYVYGGTVKQKDGIREDGQFNITINNKSPMFHHLSNTTDVLLTHGDSIDCVADGFEIVAESRESNIIVGIADYKRELYGVQFHPEVDLTTDGKQMFINFIELLCKLPRDYTLDSRRDIAVREIRETVRDNNVLVLVSGGVDSSVCAALLHDALPHKQIYALHIDNGFMRLNESQTVEHALSQVGMNLKVVDASQTFYNSTTTIDGVTTERLCDTISPEIKRKIIGDTFMRVADQHSRELGLDVDHTFLAQGTLRPDLIESASSTVSSNADVIKTHHNDTALVRLLRAKGRIIEPLRDLHKDEVRELGIELGLPEQQVWRQPFPGPGLAIRIVCTDKPYTTERDQVIIQQLLKLYTTDTITSTLLPVQTVGVQGDGRSYSSLVSLSCNTTNNMPSTEQWTELFRYARSIPKTIHGVNRVVYAFGNQLTQQHITRITPTRLTPDVISQLQHADDIVNDILIKYNLNKRLSQVPVVLFPVEFTSDNNTTQQQYTLKRSICIRTFITNDFMTGIPAMPTHDTHQRGIDINALSDIVARIISEVPNISRVCYDLTGKPPATTEWE